MHIGLLPLACVAMCSLWSVDVSITAKSPNSAPTNNLLAVSPNAGYAEKACKVALATFLNLRLSFADGSLARSLSVIKDGETTER